jgi:hypothetical protein
MLTERSRRRTGGKPARRPAVRSRSRPAARNTPIRCPGRALAASAPVTAPDAPAESHGLTAVAPRLEPELAPDFISGTRAFDAHAIKRDFPILHHRPSLAEDEVTGAKDYIAQSPRDQEAWFLLASAYDGRGDVRRFRRELEAAGEDYLHALRNFESNSLALDDPTLRCFAR